jgi:serine/threonine protein phosphatase PrpC
MTVCNVGDSRVILGHRIPDTTIMEEAEEEEKEEEKCETERLTLDDHDDSFDRYPRFGRSGEVIAIPLTRDQTAYRLDERERIRKAGGVVQSIDQMEGVAPMHDDWGDLVLGEQLDIRGDPPRVWVQGKKHPGCAFTRSFGDSTGESIGVNAEPEMVTCDLTANDEILVIASDGIFEFLTNQEVINICSASYNPLQACEAVTNAAYKKWVKHDSRSDDITIIVCFLKSMHQPSSDERSASTEALVDRVGTSYGSSSPSPSLLQLNHKSAGKEKYNRKISEIYAKGTPSSLLDEEPSHHSVS